MPDFFLKTVPKGAVTFEGNPLNIFRTKPPEAPPIIPQTGGTVHLRIEAFVKHGLSICVCYVF